MSDLALVTGATGFVGAHVVRKLLSKNLNVRVLARPSSNLSNLRNLQVQIMKGDLREPTSLRNAVQGVRYVFHVAADYRLWVQNPDDMYTTNVSGTDWLLKAAKDGGVEKIVYTSSVAALGKPRQGDTADEKDQGDLDTIVGPYKKSKFLAEEAVRIQAAHGVPVVIVNPSTPIGPQDIKPTPTGKIIVDFLNRKMPAYMRTGLNFVDVEDVAEGHWLALKKGKVGERYILGGENIELKDFLLRLGEMTGLTAPKIRIPYPVAYTVGWLSTRWAGLTKNEPRVPLDGVRMAARKMFFDSTRAKKELGYRPKPIEQALSRAIHWFKTQGYVK